MPRFDFRFDIAAILLASVLTAIGTSSAQAGGKPTGGGGGGDVHSRSGSVAANSAVESRSAGGAIGSRDSSSSRARKL
jgi:hypothetical protein